MAARGTRQESRRNTPSPPPEIDKMDISNEADSMQTISATEAKQKFAALLDLSQREPVMIQRHERSVAILISPHHLEILCQGQLQELPERDSDRQPLPVG